MGSATVRYFDIAELLEYAGVLTTVERETLYDDAMSVRPTSIYARAALAVGKEWVDTWESINEPAILMNSHEGKVVVLHLTTWNIARELLCDVS